MSWVIRVAVSSAEDVVIEGKDDNCVLNYDIPFCLNTEETKVERKERRKVTKLRQSKLCPALICSLI